MSIINTLERIDALKSELDSLLPIKPEYEHRIKQKFRLDWTYHSNSIEGNSLTYGETEKLILFDQYASDKPGRDNREVEGHNKLLKEFESSPDLKGVFTEYNLRAFHKKILGDEPYYSPALTHENKETARLITPGRYKEDPNNVKTITGEIFYFTSPLNTPPEMHQLIQWANEELKAGKDHPLIFAANLHYKFIRIHPFDDGNGRIARILMNIALQIYGYPPVIVRVDDKARYYSALRNADVGDLDSFINYIGNLLIESLELMIRGAKGEKIEDERDIDKEIELARLRLLKERQREHEALNSTIAQRALIFEKSFIPLARQLDSKLAHFKNDFTEGITYIILTAQSNVKLGYWEAPNSNAHPDFFDEIIVFLNPLKSLPNTMEYDCQFTGKTNLLREAVEINVRLKLTFGQTTYTVISGINGERLPDAITKSPSEHITGEEINDYVAKIIRSFLKALNYN